MPASRISIVIVNLNRAAMTLECIKSVVDHTKPGTYEIIVVDNGSALEDVAVLRQASDRAKLILLNRNLFFGEASNIGAERASGDHLLFLNNDVLVSAHWLEPLLAALHGEYRAGAVGPKIVHPDGELLEAGCVIRPDGWGVQIGKLGADFPAWFIDDTRVTDFCSGACVLMRTKDFFALGGFDPIFDPAYFEDADLAIRLRSIGLFTYYCGASKVRHEESVTSSRIWSAEQRNEYIATNHKKFVKRWGRYLRERIERDVEPPPFTPVAFTPEAAAEGGSSVVLYSPDPVKADPSGRSLLQAASAFEAFSDVTLAADEGFSRCRVYSLCREFGIALKSFRVRRLSDVRSADCRLIVAQETDLPAPLCFAEQFVLGRDGQQLLCLMDHLTK